MRRPLLLSLSVGLLTTACEYLPGMGDDDYIRPISSAQDRPFELLEKHGQVIYPALAILTLALIAFGILQAWRAQGLDGKQKATFKKEIVQELRRTMGGMTGEQVARAIGLEKFKTVKLLDEMVSEKQILSHTNTERLTVYRLRGVGPQ